MKDLTVIIPTLNEAGCIRELVTMISNDYPGATIIVADDGSKDDTVRLAKQSGAKVIDRKNVEIKGLTASVIHAVSETKTRFFIVIDGDMQHPPEKIAEILAKLKKGYTLVVGVRERVDSKWPLFRRLESGVATFLGEIRLGKKPFRRTDLLSGFFGCRTSLFMQTYNQNRKRFVHQGFKVLFDFLKCLPADTKWAEVKYVFGARGTGQTKIGTRHVYYFLRSLTN
jgi:dolichol-phosphate mannosyltransferase